jgi:hypothetical protein
VYSTTTRNDKPRRLPNHAVLASFDLYSPNGLVVVATRDDLSSTLAMAPQDADDAANAMDCTWQYPEDMPLFNDEQAFGSAPLQSSSLLSPTFTNQYFNHDTYEMELFYIPPEVPQISHFGMPESPIGFGSLSPRLSQYIEPLSPGSGHPISNVSPDEAMPSPSARLSPAPARAPTISNEHRLKKRFPRIKNGYSCEDARCTKKFDTQGAATKHHQRTHTPESSRPHKCPHCPRRFLWDKDIKRHIGQMHAAHQNAVALRSPNTRRPSFDLEMLFGPNGPRFTADAMFAALRAAIQMKRVAIRIRARRRSQIEPSQKYIMVTRDHLDFRAIDISGSRTSTALLEKIRGCMKVPPPPGFTLSSYSLGDGIIGHRMSPDQLFTTITNAPGGRGPLLFFLRS